MKELSNTKLYPSVHKMKNNRERYDGVDFDELSFSIQEKIDGSNISILKLNKTLHIFSRNQNITNNLTNIAGLSVFIKDNEKELLKFLKKEEVLNGEWLSSGKVKYVENLNLLTFNDRFVIFNLGKLTKLSIKELNSKNKPLNDLDLLALKEAGDCKTRKIDFYTNTISLKRINKNKFLSGLKNTINENTIYSSYKLTRRGAFFNVYGDDILLGNTEDNSFEEYITGHPYFKKSQLFNSDNIEGVIFKTDDNSIQLKYVLSSFSKPSKNPKGHSPKETEELGSLEKLMFNKAFYEDGRFHKFLQHIGITSAAFQGQTPDEIIKRVQDNGKLFGLIAAQVNWILNDICEEGFESETYTRLIDGKKQIRLEKRYLIDLLKLEIIGEK